MVGETGFEPATPWSQTRCATSLRHSPTGPRFALKMGKAQPKYGLPFAIWRKAAGGPGRNRTRNLAVMSGQL